MTFKWSIYYRPVHYTLISIIQTSSPKDHTNFKSNFYKCPDGRRSRPGEFLIRTPVADPRVCKFGLWDLLWDVTKGIREERVFNEPRGEPYPQNIFPCKC